MANHNFQHVNPEFHTRNVIRHGDVRAGFVLFWYDAFPNHWDGTLESRLALCKTYKAKQVNFLAKECFSGTVYS